MSLDWAAFPHLTKHHQELAEHYARGLGDAALAELLNSPAEQHVARLEQFHAFVLAQRDKGAQNKSQELAPVLSRSQEQLAAVQEEKRVLTQVVDTFSTRADAQERKRPIRMDAPKFDGSDDNKLVHWLLAVERCGVAQLISDDSQMVSYALSNMRGKASEWAYSTLLADANAFPTWAIFREKISAMYQPPNNEVLLQGRFFSTRQGNRSLQQYVQEMRTLCASITMRPLTESVKVPAFMNGLRHGPARQALFRKMPATMEEAVAIAFIEEQSFNSGTQTSVGTRAVQPKAPNGPTPMELGTAQSLCFNCGKPGHYKAQCRVKPRPQARGAMPRQGNAQWRQSGRGTPHARRAGVPPAPRQGNANRQ